MPTEVKAPMVGKVCNVLVAVGEEVTEDQPLVMLEAMKVEMPIAAPQNGIVAEILVKEGQAVEGDQTIIVLK